MEAHRALRSVAAGRSTPAGHEFATSVPPGRGAPAAARDAVTGWLHDEVPAQVMDDARLLVSELVTNSLLHATLIPDAPVGLRCVLTEHALRLEVVDSGAAAAIVRREPDLAHGRGGFGLHLLDVLASRWGVEHGGGTRVWFELARAA